MAQTAYNDGLNLPYSLEAEQAVLGAILMDPESINQVADILRPDYFYLPEHQAIYRVMSQKMMESQTIDFVTVLESLKSEGFFSGEEGKAYLFKMAQIVPSISNIGNYARIVREKHDVRSLIHAAREIIDDAMDPGNDPSLLMDAAEQKIYEIRQGRPGAYPGRAGQQLRDVLQAGLQRPGSVRGHSQRHRRPRRADHRPQPVGYDHRRRPPRHGQDQLRAEHRPQRGG